MSTATEVKSRPVLFSTSMVNAIRDGRKTQTRRIMKPQPQYFEQQPHWRWGRGPVGPFAIASGDIPGCFGKYMPGERLWVREAWAIAQTESQADFNAAESLYWYRADGERPGVKWKPSIHMPREASRLTLEITGVTVERVQDISEEDARAEGSAESWTEKWWQGYRVLDGQWHHQQSIGDEPPDWMREPKQMDMSHLRRSAKDNFAALWDAVNGHGAWERNDWAWKIEFRLLEE